MRYPIGYWTVGQRVLWRKPGREKWVPMTIVEIILGECERPIAARVQSTAVDCYGEPLRITPASFDHFHDPVSCPALDPRIVLDAPIRVRWKIPTFSTLENWTPWKRGHVAEIFTGHGGVTGIMFRGPNGGLRLAMAFRSEVQFWSPPPKEKNHERAE